jgi:siroheme synthase
VTIAGSGPGHPDLLTVAARRALGDAEVVVADALVSPEILDLCPGEVVVARRHGGDAPGEQADVERRVIDAALAGRRVVRLKIGDPGLFGRLAEEIAAYQEAGLEVRVLPGVSSLASVGPLTARGVADRVQVGAGRSAGGGVPQPPDWRPGTTYAFLMADRALAALAAELLRAGFPADTAVVAVSRASLRDESRWSGRLADLGEAEVPGPAVVLVGGTARLHGEPRAHRRAFPGLAQ